MDQEIIKLSIYSEEFIFLRLNKQIGGSGSLVQGVI